MKKLLALILTGALTMGALSACWARGSRGRGNARRRHRSSQAQQRHLAP